MFRATAAVEKNESKVLGRILTQKECATSKRVSEIRQKALKVNVKNVYDGYLTTPQTPSSSGQQTGFIISTHFMITRGSPLGLSQALS